MARKLVLKNFQAPGDILMLTSLVRDIKKAYPDLSIRVRTSADELFYNNPYIDEVEYRLEVFNTNSDVKCSSLDDGWEEISVHYGDENQLGVSVHNKYSIHKCGVHKMHFMYGMIGYINSLLGLDIKLTKLSPDVHLTDKEKRPFENLPKDYWVVVPGGKLDFPRKIWCKEKWKELFSVTQGVEFVQIGGAERDHVRVSFPGCDNVNDITGQTSLRDVLRVIYNARGVICPITFAMHVAACWPKKKCIILAGGGEHYTWEAYPGHDFLHTCSTLECCKNGGCWNDDCINRNNSGEQMCMEPITAKMVSDIVLGYEVENK